MNREQRVLAASISNRKAYNELSNVIDKQDFRAQYWILWEAIADYYVTDSTVSGVDTSLLLDSLAVAHPRHRETFTAIVEELGEGVSVPNVVKEYTDLKREGLETRLAEMLLTPDKDEDSVNTLMDKWRNISAESVESTTIVNPDISKVMKVYSPDQLIRVSPQSLNDRLDGGLIAGSQTILYAPTEVGKSLIAINMACGFLRDGRKVLYGGNEDAAASMIMRFHNNLSAMNKQQILGNPDLAKKRAYMKGIEHLVYQDMAPGSIAEVRKLVEEHSPEVVIIDQMANMEWKGGRDASGTEKITALSAAFRAMAKEYKFASILVHQASADAYGRVVLDKSHLHYSNVGVQGQMDVMIGIGMDATMEQQNRRNMCLTKNKLSGDHSVFPITVDPALSRVL
jgi:archaellum biogenesis ATPase FlaH